METDKLELTILAESLPQPGMCCCSVCSGTGKLPRYLIPKICYCCNGNGVIILDISKVPDIYKTIIRTQYDQNQPN
jgi:hypothetical protein